MYKYIMDTDPRSFERDFPREDPTAKVAEVRYVRAGNHLEVFEYKKARTGCVSSKKVGTGSRAGRNRGDNASRAKSAVKHLVNANHGQWPEQDKFITLTYGEDATESLTEACRHLDLFLKRMRRRYKEKWTYVAVPEIQWKRYKKYGVKAIHWHLAVFGLPFVAADLLASIWGHGFVRINKQQDFENPGKYMSDYIGKDFSEEEFNGHRRYLTGQGLLRHSQGIGHSVAEVLLAQGISRDYLVFEKTYNNNQRVGEVHYMRYNSKVKRSDRNEDKLSVL